MPAFRALAQSRPLGSCLGLPAQEPPQKTLQPTALLPSLLQAPHYLGLVPSVACKKHHCPEAGVGHRPLA